LFDDPRSGKPLRNDAAGAVGPKFEEKLFNSCMVLYRHFRTGKAMCLRVLQDMLGMKIQSSLGGACLIDQPHERKTVIFKAPFDGSDGREGK
jgi:hypothetical protein